MKKQTFLTYRADGLAKIAENYRKLEGLCIKFGLVPVSGDLMTEMSWPQPVDNNGRDLPYWPATHENSVLLTKPGTFPEHIAAVRVTTNGFYGAVIGVAGGDNLNAQELGWQLEKVTPAVVV